MVKLTSIGDEIQNVCKYVRDRMEGKVKSLNIGYPKLNGEMIDGIEWNSTVTIGGRPSVGKSAVSDCLIEGALASNLDVNMYPDFDVLDFNWEMSSKVILLRKLSAKLKKTYKYLLSADGNTLTPAEMKEIEDLLTKHYGNLPITFCEEPLTAREFADVVRRQVDKTKRKTLVRIDHTLLAKQAPSEQSQVAMLQNLMMEANPIKKAYPVAFMFLTQIKREFEERQESNTEKAFPRQGDVFGSDACSMFSETIILLNKPSKYGISYYGKRPSGHMNVEDNDLFMHIVKNRNAPGDNILHFKENFANMSIREM